MRSSRIRRSAENGYVMMTLLLTLALMIIMAAAIVPSITFEIKRDREEEMIHRGVQYSRAIRAYYKKFGRYPVSLENLENTNQQRFLRKRYKDPLTGKEFRLLHFGEAKLSLNGMSAGTIPGASTLGSNGQLNGPGGPQSNSPFGSTTFGPSANSFGQNTQAGQTNSRDSSQSDSSDNTSQSPQAAPSGGMNSNDRNSPNPQTFGGGPIVGVASTSKNPTIREFDKKKKYNEWQFVYDPTLDRGFLITTPYQPQLQMFGTGPQNVNGPNAPGQNQGLGTQTSGPTVIMGPQQPPPINGVYGNPNQPTDTPNQQ